VKGSVQLNRLLRLESATRQSDGAGGYTVVWAVLGSVWAEVRATTGQERQSLSGRISSVPYRVIVRSAKVGAVSRPKPDQRFREGERLYRIYAVADFDAAGMYLECFCKEEVLA